MENALHKTIESSQLWFPLDNAAKIFPAIVTHNNTTVFRISAVLRNPVKISSLLKVVSRLEDRFPYYRVRLKRGLFWFYLEHAPLKFPVLKDEGTPCRRFSNKGLLMRILVAENRLSVEFSHIVTDGGGAFEFFKSLLILYSQECGKNFPADCTYMKPGEEISEDEFEDSYNRYFREHLPRIIKRPKAYHIPWGINPDSAFNVNFFMIPINEIKDISAAKGVSITDFMVSAYLYVLQEIFNEEKSVPRYKHLRVQVPINLRKAFPSVTMRNFSLFVLPELDLRLGNYSFDEILKTVYHQIQLETDKKLINKNIARNVGPERKIYVKSIPLFIKSLILRIKYYTLGASQYSGVITNLGKVNLPKGMEEIISYMYCIPPPPNRVLKINCGLIGFGENLVFTFGNITRSKKLSEKMTRFLISQNITLKPINPF